MQKRILLILLGLSSLLANCGIRQSTLVDGYDFSSALMVWELRDRPDEVAEDNRFEGLTYQRAKLADRLDAAGTLVGTYVGDDLAERDIIGYLLETHIVDANQHIIATVYLMREGRDDAGYWAMLVSEDPYWTNQDNLDIYPFAIRILNNGEMWLHNADSVE